jgi:hypothetical protein|eukprot:COSAG01_NODE_16512_length_1230_cov_2.764810_2_plen_44_part_00
MPVMYYALGGIITYLYNIILCQRHLVDRVDRVDFRKVRLKIET